MGQPLKLPGASEMKLVLAYHERTKHFPHRYAASLGYMDWATQPDPFRRFAGSELLRLPLSNNDSSPTYAQLYQREPLEPEPLTLESISRFFRRSLALSAWKQSGASRWPLRVNPSSGNLHPTEAYAILPAVLGLSDAPGLYHYAAKEHALERRALLERRGPGDLSAVWPRDSFLIGLTSIHWREAWKYGERAFRYCQHDIGHALAALRIAAATLGWRLDTIENVTSDAIGELLGLNRDGDFADAEREEPEIVAMVSTSRSASHSQHWDGKVAGLVATTWFGRANVLGPKHTADWPIIDEVAAATRRMQGEEFVEERPAFTGADAVNPILAGVGSPSADEVILGRRSATAMDGKTAMSKQAFFHMLARLLPSHESLAVPWDALPWRPRIHLGLFVHRVEGLPSGLYALVRDPQKLAELKVAMSREFLWRQVSESPAGLPLYQLVEGDLREVSAAVSCGQAIAGDGCFSVAMLAEFQSSLQYYGAAVYRRLFWEAGIVGQVLYLEARTAGLAGTGIGCYFDDLVHELFGLASANWQSLYHFTVGGPVEDQRLSTLPAYDTVER
jgi:SagB-type dehydrogenase family enzyme